MINLCVGHSLVPKHGFSCILPCRKCIRVPGVGIPLKTRPDTSPFPASESRTLVSHIHGPWDERIDWYLGSVQTERPYSRRELAVDFGLHVVGLSLSCAGSVAIAYRIYARRPPAVIAAMSLLYAQARNPRRLMSWIWTVLKTSVSDTIGVKSSVRYTSSRLTVALYTFWRPICV